MRATCIRLVRVLPRSAVPKYTTILPPTPPAPPPSLVQTLVARQEAAGDNWPPNLRIETFEDSREDWVGVKKEIRTKLKKMFVQEH